jgi:cytochrome P450
MRVRKLQIMSGHDSELPPLNTRAQCPVQKVRLADGHPAWVVLGYDAARHALGDPRISKDMLAALQDNGDVVAEGLPAGGSSRGTPSNTNRLQGERSTSP